MSAEESAPVPGLTLYQTFTCAYCGYVRETAEDLGIVLESRDVGRDLDAMQALYRARGRGQVPVLRIEGQDGEAEWLAESVAIVAYLKSRFGEAEDADGYAIEEG